MSSIDPLMEVRMPLRLTRYNANINPDREKENHPFHGNPIVKFLLKDWRILCKPRVRARQQLQQIQVRTVSAGCLNHGQRCSEVFLHLVLIIIP